MLLAVSKRAMSNAADQAAPTAPLIYSPHTHKQKAPVKQECKKCLTQSLRPCLPPNFENSLGTGQYRWD